MKLNIKNTLKSKVIKYLVFILVAICTIIAFCNIGKTFYPAFPFNINISNPSNVCCNLNTNNGNSNQNYNAVIDSQGNRLLILNSDNKLIKQVEINTDNKHIHIAENVYIYDNEIYVSGYLLDENVSRYTKACVCKFDINGNYVATL